MKHSSVQPIKYKFLSFDELVINIDRLSRFKLPEESFFRVFSSVLLKCLLSPCYSKKEIENLDAEYVCKLTEEIWNASVVKLFGHQSVNFAPNHALKLLINNCFKISDKRTVKFLKANLFISPLLEKLYYDNAPLNLKFLITVNNCYKDTEFGFEDLEVLRERYMLEFPLKKLIIAEGITEEILLPVFADKLHCNFKKEGVVVLGAGGKSKSPSLYMKFKEKLKIPVLLLFDSDAREICRVLNDNLLKKDKILIIEKGEFEDILSLNLIKRSLNKEYTPVTLLTKKELRLNGRMCENISNFYKTRHLGEFKKSTLSKLIAANLKYKTDITDDIKDIINIIIQT